MNMHEKILAVATSLFESKGINASGVDTIIAESGIAKSTLYKHFPSKNVLITAYLKEKSDRFYNWVNASLSSRNSASADSLAVLCDSIEQWILKQEFHGLPFHIASVEFPDPEHPINKYSVELAKELQSYLTGIAAKAGVKDPETLGQQLAIIFEGASLLESLSPGKGAATRAKNAALTLIKASK